MRPFVESENTGDLNLGIKGRLSVIEANQVLIHDLLMGTVGPDGVALPGLVRRMERIETVALTSLGVLRWIGGGIGAIAVAVVTLVFQNMFTTGVHP